MCPDFIQMLNIDHMGDLFTESLGRPMTSSDSVNLQHGCISLLLSMMVMVSR